MFNLSEISRRQTAELDSLQLHKVYRYIQRTVILISTSCSDYSEPFFALHYYYICPLLKFRQIGRKLPMASHLTSEFNFYR